MTTATANSSKHVTKFQQLLRELFQFDCADLDFGIYRIMNYKRDAIEKFITEKLPADVSEELDRGILRQQAWVAETLEETRQNVINGLGSGAIDAEGELNDGYVDTPLGRAYLNAKAAAKYSRSRDALEASIYNHLSAFFSRYYQDGDFISTRRYGRNQKYAIPYNGEEVYLHWANSDQYYVKTGERFHDYDWKAPNGVVTHFLMQTARVEQNNVKGDKRFFLPRVAETKWNENARAVVIPFEYRPLNAKEQSAYGNRNQQDKIIAEAVQEIPQRLGANAPEAVAAMTGERRLDSNGQSVSYLEHHLRQYTRKNTSDFFIHKDLSGFLNRELDFYIKNEALNLGDLIIAGENMAGGWFQIVQLIKIIGARIIEFLAQIETFQKMLWEKRKFIVETQYCITIGNISADFYSEIAANDAQWAEWRELGIDYPPPPPEIRSCKSTQPSPWTPDTSAPISQTACSRPSMISTE